MHKEHKTKNKTEIEPPLNLCNATTATQLVSSSISYFQYHYITASYQAASLASNYILNMVKSVILSIDVGSSSIRCTPYYTNDTSATNGTNNTTMTSSTSTSNGTKPAAVTALPQCASTCKISCVEPETGHILLQRTDTCSSNSTSQSKTILQDINSCIDETIASLRIHHKDEESFQIVAIGITTFVMNLMGVGADGDFLSLGKGYTCSYACNSQSVQQQCRALKQSLGDEKEKDMYQRTGAPIHPAYALGQLRDIYEKMELEGVIIKAWTTIASMCIAQWSGADICSVPISYSEASWTGMLDFHSGKWDEECMDLLPKACRDALPIVSNEVVKGLSLILFYKERWPEMIVGCQFMLGCGDGACANIGSKCTDVDRIAVTIGTSAAARIILPLKLIGVNDRNGSSDEDDNGNAITSGEGVKAKRIKRIEHGFRVPPGLFCYRIDADSILLGGALTDGGSVIAWLRDLLNLKSDEEYIQCEQKAYDLYMKCTDIDIDIEAHDSKPLTFVPFLSGERSTGYRGSATGCILGLTRHTKPVDLIKESLESVVSRINAILELILRGSKDIAGINVQDLNIINIVASGNALENNELWRQMLADCSKINVILDNETHEGTSRGAALMVVKMLAKSAQLPKEPLSVSHTSKPNDSVYQLHWSRKKEVQDEAIRILEPMWK